VGRSRAAILLAAALPVAAAGCGGDGGGDRPAATTAPPRTFTNPVLGGNFADPSLLRIGDSWYAYATGDLVVNLQVARSRDRAPEVARTPAGFVLYSTVRHADSGRQCISVAVARQPEGPLRDTRRRPLVCQERLGGSIDPSRFVDRDGSAYLLWKNDGNCCDQPTELWGQRLDGDGLALEGEPVSLGTRDDAAWEGDLIEAPTLWREVNTYHLFFSANDYASPGYGVGYATARRVLGPYHDGPGKPILRSRGSAAGPGGQALVRTGNGGLWLAYHARDGAAVGDEAGGQRSMWLDRLEFVDGRPRVDGPTDGPQEAP